jgi:hypothetical protein
LLGFFFDGLLLEGHFFFIVFLQFFAQIDGSVVEEVNTDFPVLIFLKLSSQGEHFFGE